jgi:hypothetical protein
MDETLVEEYGFDPEGLLGDPAEPATWRLNSIENYVRYDTTTLVEGYRLGGAREPITTVVLGCTHFPYSTETIAASFRRLRKLRTPEGGAPYEHLIAEELHFVDPAEQTAVVLFEELAARNLLDDDGVPAGVDELYISVPNAESPGVELRPDGRSFTHAFKYGRSAGNLDLEHVRRVPMSRDTLSPEVIEDIRRKMPMVWRRLVRFSATSPRCAGIPEQDRIRGAMGEDAIR